MPIGTCSLRGRNVLAEYGSSSCESDEEEEAIAEQPHAERQSRRRRRERGEPRYPRPHSHLFRKASGKRARGNKHARRWENSAFLSTLFEVKDDDLLDDHTLVLPPHTSSFQHLLKDGQQQQLQMWHQFTELTEDEQKKVLAKSTSDKKCNNAVTDTECSLRRIDRRIRFMLTHNKRIPIAFIKNLEVEVAEIIGDDNNSTLVFLEPSSYHRMLTYAVFQYLGLTFKTVDWSGKSLIIVAECTGEFTPPSASLSSLLSQNTNLMNV